MHLTRHISPILPLLATALLTSCSSDVHNSDDALFHGTPLTFSVTSTESSTSRANDSYKALPSTYDVYLRAYHIPLSGSSIHYGYEDIPLSYVGSSYSHIASEYYYPLSGTMEFMAYSAVTEREVEVADDFTSMSVDFGNNLDGHDDVLYSIPITDAPCGTLAQTQQLKMHHGLAKLNFSVQAAESFGDNSITITGVDVTRCSRSGKMTIHNDGRTENIVTWEPYDVKLYATLDESFPLTINPHEHFVYIVPSDQTHVRLLYTITYDNGDVKEVSYINHKLDLKNKVWEPDHEYFYKFILYEHLIEVNYIDFQGHDACTSCFLDVYANGN